MDSITIQNIALLASVAAILPVLSSFVLPMSYDLRKDMYKSITIETLRLSIVLFMLETTVDMSKITLKIACIICGLFIYYTVLDRFTQTQALPTAHDAFLTSLPEHKS